MKVWQRAICAAVLSALVASCAGSPKSGSTPQAKAPASALGSQSTLAQVKARGVLNCGANTGLAGFGAQGSDGKWYGFDVEFCRAVAAAIFGDATKVAFKPLSTQERFVALQSGEVDLLARNSVWTLSRDTQLGLDFPTVTFYDGQGFMVRRSSGIASLAQLKGATVCVQGGTTTEFLLRQYSRTHNLGIQALAFAESARARSAYDEARCTAYTTDSSALAAERTGLGDLTAHIILPGLISKEPLAPAVRQGDNQWADILRWVHFAMVIAEEKGIDSAHADEARNSSQDFEVRRLFGVDGNMSEGLGLPHDWAYNVIKQVGNYAESFERNFGRATPFGMERGPNALWSKGGLQFAPPVR
jgi:general L-amino acid transport system substrate-binding protein